MNKFTFLPLFLALTSAHAVANRAVQEGFVGPFNGINTAALAREGADNSFVQLTGNILASLGGEIYQFSDHTGTVNIEIEHEKWFGLSVTPENIIIVDGVIDKGLKQQVTVNVDRLRLAR